MSLNLTGILALALLLVGAWAWVLSDSNARKTERITQLETEAEARETAEIAAGIARGIAGAGRVDVEREVRAYLERFGNAGTSEACARDPAIAGAYDSMQRMRDTHENALSTAAERVD